MREEWSFVELATVVMFAVFASVGLVLTLAGTNVEGINIGAVMLALETAYLVFSFGTVKVEEVAAKFCFGAPAGNLTPGLYFAPPGVMEVRKGKATQYQDELPGEPRQIFRQDDVAPVPPGMFPPIRVKFGVPRKDDPPTLKNDPYNIAMTAEVVPVVSWKITDATAFFTNYEDVDVFRRILEDKAIEVFGNEFSGVTPARALSTLSTTSTILQKKIETETANTGVQILDAYVKPFIFSHPLNTAVVRVSIAKRDAEAVRVAASAEKDRLTSVGIGNANARKLMLEAEAIGIAKLAEIAKTHEGQVTLWMETMKEAFTKAQYSIVPGSEIFTAYAGLSEAVKKIKTGGS
ncbi:MAG: hypothetical protein CEO12_610 [Parcubacteria group bacterium Gr01-1014_46]|nr:MAG: hypothetical protein CEO12_610 [Parcubacteria group bacterium Gr01-1014_46]